MGDPAGPSGARARKARAETRAQPVGPGEGQGRRGLASAELRVSAVLSCPPRVRLGGRAALDAARPEGCLHVPKPKSPDPGDATKLGSLFGLGDSGGSSGWSAWMKGSVLLLGHILSFHVRSFDK